MGKHHGECAGRTPEYQAWRDMKSRCAAKRGKRHRLYVQRGITVQCVSAGKTHIRLFLRIWAAGHRRGTRLTVIQTRMEIMSLGTFGGQR